MNNDPRLIIIRGLHGSGKSKKALELADKYSGQVVSVDHYFEDKGDYHFVKGADYQHLKRAHDNCRVAVETLMNAGTKTIIVDGTHPRKQHVAPYVALAKTYGYEVETIFPDGQNIWDAKICTEHSEHKVPLHVNEALLRRFERNIDLAA